MTAPLFKDPLQTTWVRPKGKKACGRDPAAGPGTCSFWWDGCPKAEERGCYNRWQRQMIDAGYKYKSACGTTFATEEPQP